MQRDLFEIAAGRTLESLAAYLNDGARIAVGVTLTRNRVSMASVRFRDRRIDVRLHQAYLAAPDEIHKALRLYLRTRRRTAWDAVAAFAQSIEVPAKELTRTARRVRSAGAVYDLSEIYREVNARYFSGRVRCVVGWGRQRPQGARRRRSRSIRFGSWSASTRTVRVHPLLDDVRVPRKFVEYIVFHEMLHAVVPSQRSGGRRYDHPAEFRTLEGTFPELDAMKRLAKELLNRLT